MAPKRKAQDSADGAALAKVPRKAGQLIHSLGTFLTWQPKTLTITHKSSGREWNVPLNPEKTEVTLQEAKTSEPALTVSPAQVLEAKDRSKLSELLCHEDELDEDGDIALNFNALRTAALRGGLSKVTAELEKQYLRSSICFTHNIKLCVSWKKGVDLTSVESVQSVLDQVIPGCALTASYASSTLAPPSSSALSSSAPDSCAVPCPCPCPCAVAPTPSDIEGVTKDELIEERTDGLVKASEKYSFSFDSVPFPFGLSVCGVTSSTNAVTLSLETADMLVKKAR
jgi:hypothetical protein